MNHIYLEQHDAEKNMHRFYQMFVLPGLIDDWSLVREWGRVHLVPCGKTGLIQRKRRSVPVNG